MHHHYPWSKHQKFAAYFVLSAFAEDHGRESMDECARGTLRSSESEGGCFGGLHRRNEGYHGRKPVKDSLIATQMEIEPHCLESIWRAEIVEGCEEHNISVSELKGGGRRGTIS
jgi:hypothetical protein